MHSSNLFLTSVRNRLMNTAMTENFVISFVISRYVEPEVYKGLSYLAAHTVRRCVLKVSKLKKEIN